MLFFVDVFYAWHLMQSRLKFEKIPIAKSKCPIKAQLTQKNHDIKKEVHEHRHRILLEGPSKIKIRIQKKVAIKEKK